MEGDAIFIAMSLSAKARRWYVANEAILGNTLSLGAATATTSLLGFVYWAVAARVFSATDVGLASAAVSLMLLLGSGGMVGLGTLLLNELPRRRGSAGPMISAALTAGGGGALLLWVAVAGVTRLLGGTPSPPSTALLASPIFAVGVVLTTTSSILDMSLVALLRGGTQLWRNVIFAATKLALLPAAALVANGANGTTILLTWVLGLAVSLLAEAGILIASGNRLLFGPRLRWLGRLGGETLKHHVLNFTISGPRLLLPVLAATLVSARGNAAFYAAWMLVSLGLMIPTHFSTVLQAVGSGDPAHLAPKLRFSLRLALLLGAIFTVVLIIVAPWLLQVFGPYYRVEATVCLRVLALAVCPFALKLHFVTVGRVHHKVGRAATQMLLGGLLEVGFAAAGAVAAGITGLAIGYLLALALEAVLTIPTLAKELRETAANG